MYIKTCEELTKCGIPLVPHVVARNIEDKDQYKAILKTFSEISLIRSVLLLAGDRRNPAGPYGNSLDLIVGHELKEIGIDTVLFAGYPQGHPLISNEELTRYLGKKIDYAISRDLKVEVVTQLCGCVEKSAEWIKNLYAEKNVLARMSVPVGRYETINRQFKKIYSNASQELAADGSGWSRSGFIESAARTIKRSNIIPKLHLISFDEIDTLLSIKPDLNSLLNRGLL